MVTVEPGRRRRVPLLTRKHPKSLSGSHAKERMLPQQIKASRLPGAPTNRCCSGSLMSDFNALPPWSPRGTRASAPQTKTNWRCCGNDGKPYDLQLDLYENCSQRLCGSGLGHHHTRQALSPPGPIFMRGAIPTSCESSSSTSTTQNNRPDPEDRGLQLPEMLQALS